MQVNESRSRERNAPIERDLEQSRAEQACPPGFDRKRQDDASLVHKHRALQEADRAHRDLAPAPFLLDKTPGYDGWLFEKLTTTLERLEAGQTKVHDHDEVMTLLRERLAARNRRA